MNLKSRIVVLPFRLYKVVLSKETMAKSFLDLPREIRDMIYAFLLRQKQPLNPSIQGYPHSIETNILYVNHRINAEGTEILYSQNVFHIGPFDRGSVLRFTNKIGQENTNAIRHIRIHWTFPIKVISYTPSTGSGLVPANHQAVVGLCNCININFPGLRSIRLVVWETDRKCLKKIIFVDGYCLDTLLDKNAACFSSCLRSSSGTVLVEDPCRGLEDYVKRKMEDRGWQILAEGDALE